MNVRDELAAEALDAQRDADLKARAERANSLEMPPIQYDTGEGHARSISQRLDIQNLQDFAAGRPFGKMRDVFLTRELVEQSLARLGL